MPAVRVKAAATEPEELDDLPTDTKVTPFKMGGHGAPAFGATLTGVAAAVAPTPAPDPAAETPAPAQAAATGPDPTPAVAVSSAQPVAASAEKPKPPALPAPEASAAKPGAAPADSKITKTLVSARDSIDSITGLAEAIAVADEPSDAAAPAPIDGAKPQQGDDDVTAPAKWPAGGAAAPVEEARPAPVAAAPAPATPPAEALPLPPARQASRPRPAAEPRGRPPLPSNPLPRAEQTITAPLPVPFHGGVTGRDGGPEPSAKPAVSQARPESVRPPASEAASSRTPSVPPAKSGGDRAPASQASSGPPPARAPLLSSADLDVPKRRLDEQVAVPLSSLVGGGGLLIGLVIAAFFVGRASSFNVPRLTAHPSLGAVPVVARATLPPPPKPCWMVKQPAMWAAHASRTIPFDAVATKSGTLAIGYAHDARQAMGIEVDLATGEVKSRLDDKAREEIERIVPLPNVEFRVARTGTGGPLRAPMEVATPDAPAQGSPQPGGQPLFAVGLTESGIALAAPPEGGPVSLWPLTGDEGLGASSIRPAGDRGFVLVFRRGGAVWGGFIGADHKPAGALVTVAGSGGAVGKPSAGWNGHEVAVIFADRPEAEGHYEMRVGHAPPGEIPATTVVLPLPRGGPGGDAFSPDIAGLPDGRWLLMWTEGAAGARAVRAQTLAADFGPLGDPIALSPPAGNFGQGVIGVVGRYAATVFLQKGSSSYELWGAVLQCGE
jgi:hypothetical protein